MFILDPILVCNVELQWLLSCVAVGQPKQFRKFPDPLCQKLLTTSNAQIVVFTTKEDPMRREEGEETDMDLSLDSLELNLKSN